MKQLDFHELLKQRMINALQGSLKQIRQVLNLGAQEFSDIVGLTRQSINNLENQKIKMSAVQFVAICAVIDHFVEAHPETKKIIISILNSNDTLYDNKIYEIGEDESFLKKWFSCFSNDSKVYNNRLNMIEELVSNYKIFIDDTGLSSIAELGQVGELIASMRQKSKKFIIPAKVIEALQNKLLNEYEVDLNAAKRGMDNLQSFQKDGICEIRGERSDTSVISTMVSVFAKYKVIYRLALITQSKNIAESIMALNYNGIGGFQIMVFRCADDYSLEEWENGEVKCNEIGDLQNQKDMSSDLKMDVSQAIGWEKL